jgi:hypothetical protein
MQFKIRNKSLSSCPMRKKHVSESAASKAVWLCDESRSHSRDESKTRIPKEKWIEN